MRRARAMPELTAQWSGVIAKMTYKKVFESTISRKSGKMRFDILKNSLFNSFRINAVLRGVVIPRPFLAGTHASEFLGSS